MPPQDRPFDNPLAATMDQPGETAELSGFARERLILGSEPRYTRFEVARLAGVPQEHAVELWRSLGFAAPGDEDVAFTDADVAALKTTTALRQSGVISAETELALTRSLSQALARLAEWQADLLNELVSDELPPDADAVSREQAGLVAAGMLLPQMEQLQRYVWRRHLLAAEKRLASAAEPAGQAPAQAVGFADIVGFTSLSRGLDRARLADFLEDFEGAAAAVVAEHGGRVIKMVGDEVMFAATGLAAGDIGLALADRVSALDGRPSLRVGMAYGPVLRRLGDVFGTVVNMAARLTAVARPGTVLVDRELAEVLGEEQRFDLKRLHRVSVRGFSHLQPFLLRPADD